jgi:hypothetical protein
MDATGREIAHNKLVARGRLKEARKWFTIRGWKVLPHGNRGQQILKWGGDHAWLAAENDWKRKRSVHNWCRRWAPSLTEAELDQLVADTVTSNKRWTHDQCAAVLEITVRDRQAHGFRFLGADDDPNYKLRDAEQRAKAAKRERKYRAANGAKPRTVYEANSLSRTRPWEQEGISRRTWERRRSRETETDASPSRHIRLRIGSVMDLRHESQPPDHPSRARQATRRQAPIIDDPEHAPCAVAAGATKGPKLERRTS